MSKEKKEETPEIKERISKRRAKVFSLLKKFNNETTQVKKQINKINADLKVNQIALSKNLNELQGIDAELNRRKEQLEAFAEISETYIDFVCEKFDVEKDQIIKIRESKN
jgi:septal ring factor EnvC (AmiA/AmiB activator)